MQTNNLMNAFAVHQVIEVFFFIAILFFYFAGGFGITAFMTSMMCALGTATLNMAFPLAILPPKAMLLVLSSVIFFNGKSGKTLSQQCG